MQKIIEDREKRKKKWIRLGKISAISLVSIIIAVRILCSSYAFCNWYLPLASHSLGIRITADEVKFTPFSSKKHLNFRGLQIEIKDKLIFTATSFKTKISFFDLLFHRKYSLDNVTVDRASLVIYDLRQTQEEKEKSGLERIRIGSVEVNDLSIRYAPENSAVYGKAFLDKVHIDSMLPNQVNTMKISSFLAWNMPDSSMMNLPVESNIQFMLDQELAPLMLKMEIETKQLSGHIYKQNLSGLRLKALLDCKIDDKSKITVNQISFRQFDEKRETFKLNALGFYDMTTRCGSLQIEAAADKMSTSLLPTQYTPRDLNLRFSGTLLKNGAELKLDSNLKLDAESIVKDEKKIIQEPQLHFDSRLKWNIQEKNLTIARSVLKVFSNGTPLFTMKTSENFALTINQDTSWNLASADSTLQLNMTECSLALLNSFIPFQFGSGSLNGTCELQVNAAEKSVSGTFQGTAKDVELLHNGKLIFRKFPMHFKGELLSKTLKNISSFDILSATVTYGNENATSLNVAGKVHLNTEGIALKGILKTDVPAITEHIVPIDQERCKKILALFGNCTKQNEHEITLNFFPEKQMLDFSIRSILNELTLPQMNRAIKLNFACTGQFFRKNDFQQVRLREITLSAPGDLELRASANMSLPDGVCEGQLRLNRISPDLLRGIWLACKNDPEKAANWIRKIYFSNLTASADFRLSGKEQSILVSNVFLCMTHQNGGSGTLTLKAPITGTLHPCRFNETPASVTFQKFPMQYGNTLFSDQSPVRILPSVIDCNIELTFKNNFKDIPFYAEGVVDQLHWQKGEMTYDFGSCRFKTEAEFKNVFSSIAYKNTFWELKKQGHKQSVAGSGKFLLKHPYSLDMFFTISQFNYSYLATFFPFFAKLGGFSHVEADTRINLHYDQDYTFTKFILEQNIKKLTPRFPAAEQTAPPDLNGTLHLDLTYRAPEKILTLNKSFIELLDQNGTLRYHAELHGAWDGSEKSNRSSCTFTSNAADLRTAYLAYKAYKEAKDINETIPEKSEEKSAVTTTSATFSATAPKNGKTLDAIRNTLKRESEPEAIDLNNFSTELAVDLKNWTYTDNLQLALKGTFTVDQNIFHAQELAGTVNNAPFLLDAYADLDQNDGWILKLLCKVNDLEIAPLINTFGSDDLKSRNITGKINRMEANLNTKGVTINSLDKNLNCKIHADFSNISCPLVREDEELSSWQILLVPLTIFPRIYDLLPEGAARDAVQNFLGGSHIDVLTGNKNITLDRGTISIQNASKRKTDLVVTKFLFTGPVFNVASKDFTFNPFHNTIRAEILTKFVGTVFPVKLKGALNGPDFELTNILGNALLGPLKKLNVFEDDDPVWDFNSPPVAPAD